MINPSKERISHKIRDQFPEIFRETAAELVEFVSTYYSHLDDVLQKDYFKIYDIDTTYDHFLEYFKNQYLNGIDIPENIDVKFLFKNIHDLYRRKGTEEGIRLLFNIYFGEEPEIYYPKVALLAPSASQYTQVNYLEMRPVQKIDNYDLEKGMYIEGQVSGARAFVQNIVFKNLFGENVPIVYLSDKQGEFTAEDRIIILNRDGTFNRYSNERIQGSLSDIQFSDTDTSSPGNAIGDILNVVPASSSSKGFAGTAIVKDVTTSTSGAIDISVIDGGYGYILPNVEGTGTLVSAISYESDIDRIVFNRDTSYTGVPNTDQAVYFPSSQRYYGIESIEVPQNIDTVGDWSISTFSDSSLNVPVFVTTEDSKIYIKVDTNGQHTDSVKVKYNDIGVWREDYWKRKTVVDYLTYSDRQVSLRYLYNDSVGNTTEFFGYFGFVNSIARYYYQNEFDFPIRVEASATYQTTAGGYTVNRTGTTNALEIPANQTGYVTIQPLPSPITGISDNDVSTHRIHGGGFVWDDDLTNGIGESGKRFNADGYSSSQSIAILPDLYVLGDYSSGYIKIYSKSVPFGETDNSEQLHTYYGTQFSSGSSDYGKTLASTVTPSGVTLLFVGAPGYAGAGSEGRVLCHVLSSSGTILATYTINNPQNTNADSFGTSLVCNSNYLVVNCDNAYVFIYDISDVSQAIGPTLINTQTATAALGNGNHPDKISGIAISDNNYIVMSQNTLFTSGSSDGSIRVIDCNDNFSARTISAHTVSTWDKKYFGDAVAVNNKYVFVSWNKTVFIYRLDDLSRIGMISTKNATVNYWTEEDSQTTFIFPLTEQNEPFLAANDQFLSMNGWTLRTVDTPQNTIIVFDIRKLEAQGFNDTTTAENILFLADEGYRGTNTFGKSGHVLFKNRNTYASEASDVDVDNTEIWTLDPGSPVSSILIHPVEFCYPIDSQNNLDNTIEVDLGVDGTGYATLHLLQDITTESLQSLTLTLEPESLLGANTGEPSVSVLVSDTSVGSGDTQSIADDPTTGVYTIVLDENISEDYQALTPVHLVDKNTVNEIYNTNQTIVVSADSARLFSLNQIADEVERIAFGLTTPSQDTPEYIELFQFLNAFGPSGFKNADINFSGEVTVLDAQNIRLAAEGKANAIALLNNRFDKYTKISIKELETISLYDELSNKIATGKVIAYLEPVLHISTTQGNQFPVLGSDDDPITLVREEESKTIDAVQISTFNNTAKFQFSELGDYKETVDIFTQTIDELFNETVGDYFSDIIEDVLDTNSYELGEVSGISILDSGSNYDTETYFKIVNPFIRSLGKNDFYIIFKDLDLSFFEGDIITQELTSPFRSVENYQAKAIFNRRDGEKFYFTLKSFYSFEENSPIQFGNRQYNISTLDYDTTTKRLGNNSNINSKTQYGNGQILSAKIINTGYKYNDGDAVKLINSEGRQVATAQIKSTGTGFTEGRWTTRNSFLNQADKFIQDSEYYQAYSFDLGSSIIPERYVDIVENLMKVAGTKMFSTPIINTINDVVPAITTEIEFFDILSEPFMTEAGTIESPLESVPMITEDDSANLVTVEALTDTKLII